MADQDTGLPIRSEADGADERVHVKIVDGTGTAVNQMTVDSDKNAHVEAHGNDPAGIDRVIKTSEDGSTDVDGVYNASANTEPANIGVVAQERNAAASDTRQTQQITGKRGTVDTTVVSMDVSLHDEDGNAYTSNNPIPVSLEESEGDEICDYQTSATVIKNASATHDYTVSGSMTFIGDRAWISGSGKLKVEIQVQDPGEETFSTKWVGFNSTANPNVDIDFAKIMKVPTGDIVRLKITNLDNQPQDLYSTLVGIEK